MAAFGERVFKEVTIKIISLGWPLIQNGRCPQKIKSGLSHVKGENNVKTERGHPSTSKGERSQKKPILPTP